MEVGENGTQHFQGYVEFSSQMRFKRVKRLLGDRVHLETSRGTAQQNKTYCTKTSTRAPGAIPVEFGNMGVVSQGERNDLLAVKAMVDEGKEDKELWESHFVPMVKYNKGITMYRSVKTVKRNFPTEVHVLIGPTGTGKSRWCYENYANAYWKTASKWWCGYNACASVVCDDFYGWLPYHETLRLCDRYPMMVETKGGHMEFVAKTICFSSNRLPDKWWKDYSGSKFAPFARRVHTWHFVGADHVTFSDYDQFIQYAQAQPGFALESSVDTFNSGQS